MVKKKTVKKVVAMSEKGLSNSTTTINTDTVKASREEISELMRSDTIVPSQVFGESSIAEEQIMAKEGPTKVTEPKFDPDSEVAPIQVQQTPAEEESPLRLETDIPGPELEEKAEPIVLSNEEITSLYIQQQNLNQQMIEKQYILEWKMFGEEYKGKYNYLQIDKELYIFGTSKDDVEFIPAKNVKEAYAKFCKEM